MEELTETSFFKIASGTDRNVDFESTYKDFTYKIFEMCNVTRINYGALVFTLNHTSIELSSLLEIIADSEV